MDLTIKFKKDGAKIIEAEARRIGWNEQLEMSAAEFLSENTRKNMTNTYVRNLAAEESRKANVKAIEDLNKKYEL